MAYETKATGAKHLSHTMKKKRMRISPATSMPMITGESHFRIIGLGGRRHKSQLSDEDEHADDVSANIEVL
jgi:hypothetical protein